jgi:hypothetical protein
MQQSGRMMSGRTVPDIFDSFYRKRQSGRWRHVRGLLLSATGAVALGMTILAGGVYLAA